MERIRVTVVDMQPIMPAVGGGRQRLLGLYHALGSDIDCTYVGTYDWPGEPHRDQQITPGLREILVPLSEEHHAAAAALSQQLEGRTTIDIAFPDQVYLSPDFLRIARAHITEADVVVFSHPWCFPPLAASLKNSQLVAYDSQNVEAVLRASLYDDLPEASPLLCRIAEMEYALCQRADLILACSREDADSFSQLFEMDPYKLRIVPNGTFTERFKTLYEKDKIAIRRKLNLPTDRAIALFIGSMYGPNVDAARFTLKYLASRCHSWHFVIAGGVGEALQSEPLPQNVTLTGRVDDTHRDELLLASDLALNPMTSGSGTNIKMFDYMAAGLPILTSPIGARGICTIDSAPDGIWVDPIERFPSRCNELIANILFSNDLCASVRQEVRRRFSWERISPEVGVLLKNALGRHHTSDSTRYRIAMLCTWNVICGIGEHSAYLTEGLRNAGGDVLILGNKLDNHKPEGFVRDLHFAVSGTWVWDNIFWRDSGIDFEHFETILRLGKSQLLIIQHHTAFFPFDQLLKAVMLARNDGIHVAIEAHNARHLTTEQKELLCEAGATLLVHHDGEREDLPEKFNQSVRIFPHPVRRIRLPRPSAKPSLEMGPVIGGFGFLRPYKGILTAIQTLALLRQAHPQARYRGWHALYPGDSSEDYLHLCLREAEKLNVRDAVDIDTRFLPIDAVAENLKNTNIVLMPYDPSDEGASGAANIALAAGAAVVTSSAAIFRPLNGLVEIVEQDTPYGYAQVIDQLLRDPAKILKLRKNASVWAKEHSYEAAATSLMESVVIPPRARAIAAIAKNSELRSDSRR